MAITETLHGFGSWELELSDDIPDDVLTKVGFLGHLVVVDGPVDVAATADGLLAGARYVGVCRSVAKPGSYTRDGDGLLFWLADEDGKGHFIETAITLTNATLAAWVAALLPPTVTVGTVHPQPDPAQRLTETFIFKSRTEALDVVCDIFGVELRVNGAFSVDVGTAAQLYQATLPLTSKPSPIIVRRSAGSDIDLEAVGGQVQTEGDGRDYSTRVLVVGETVGTADVPAELFVTAAASAPTVPYKDPQGGVFKATRVISQSSETTTTAAATAALNLNRFNRTKTAVKVTAEDYETEGAFQVGDAAYVYDPDSGITDPTREVLFRGEVLHPQVIRVAGHTWPIVDGYTVAWRTDAGVWLDLTPWVVWETAGTHELVVGDLPRALTRGAANPVTDRVDAARGDSRDPKAPTGLVLSTSSSPNLNGFDTAIIGATWDPVTQNTDNTAAAVAHYEVQQRPTFRAPGWFPGGLSVDASAEIPVAANLSYDVRVRAVSTSGRTSAWSATVSILSAKDSTAPAAPSDPVLSPYLGLLRITWDGLTATGAAMPADFNRVDVHVGTTAAFTASQTTLVTSMSTAGSHPVYAPYGATRYVRLIAYDHNGNPSAASGTISGATVQAADGDIQSLNVGKLVSGTVTADVVNAGRIATALTGARVEMNALGFQKFDSANALLVSITGTEALLTGVYKTASEGRRVEIGSSGDFGSLKFFDQANVLRGQLAAFTLGALEVVNLRNPIAGVTSSAWNSLQIESDESAFLISRVVTAIVGGSATGTRGFSVEYAPDRNDINTGRRSLLTVLPDDTDAFFTSAGAFEVYERSTADNSLTRRLGLIGGGWSYFYHPTGQGTSFSQRNADGTTHTRLSVDNIDVLFRWPSVTGRARFRQRTDASVSLQLLNNGGYGSLIWAAANADGTNHRLEIKDAVDSGHIPVWASSFVVASSAEWKTGIRPLGPGSLAKLNKIRPSRFRRRASQPDETELLLRSEWDTREEVGVIAEQMPPDLVVSGPEGLMVDVMASLVTTIAAVQELAAEVNVLRGRAV